MSKLIEWAGMGLVSEVIWQGKINEEELRMAQRQLDKLSDQEIVICYEKIVKTDPKKILHE